MEERQLTARTQEPTDHVDDEYSRAGVYDPKILLTTSRDPSSKLMQFSKVRRPPLLRFRPSSRADGGGAFFDCRNCVWSSRTHTE